MSTAFLIHTDGASRPNPGPSAFAYTIEIDNPRNVTRQYFPIKVSGFLGDATNNQAEYAAVILAMVHVANIIGWKEATKREATIVLHSDSELIIKQLNREYSVKDEKLIPLFNRANGLAQNIGVEFHHIRREHNTITDSLCNDVFKNLHLSPIIVDPVARIPFLT